MKTEEIGTHNNFLIRQFKRIVAKRFPNSSESCPAGSYKNDNMNTCEECPDNMISSEGAALCATCELGQERNTERTGCGKNF